MPPTAPRPTRSPRRPAPALFVLLATLALVPGSPLLLAASDTWTGSVSGDWSDSANWLGGNSPGSTSGTTNADIATFNSSSTNTVITIDPGRVINGITFDTASVSGYTIGGAGANTGNTLFLSSGGSISLTATVPDGTTETVNAPLSLGGNYTFNNLGTGTARFVVAGNITNTATSLLEIDTQTGATGVNLFSGSIGDGGGVMSVRIGTTLSSGFGTGRVEFSGANSYSGNTQINFVNSTGVFTTSGSNSSATGTTTLQHGTLNLDSLANGGIAGGTLALQTGTLQAQIAGAGVLANTVTVANSFTVAGAQSITFNGNFTSLASSTRGITNNMTAGVLLFNGAQLNLGNLTTTGNTFFLGGTGDTIVKSIIQDYSGGVGTAAGSLILDPTSGGTITLTGANTYTGATTLYGGGKVNVSSIGNTGVAGNLGVGAVINIGSGTVAAGILSYTGGGETIDRTINLGGTTGGATLDQSGASGALKFTADLTATGAGSKTLTLQGSTAATGELAGAVVDNSGTNTTKLAKTGTGTWTLSGSNTYTGTTTLNAGTLVLDYSARDTSKLSDTAALLLNGGTLALSGGSHAEAVLATTLNTGGTFITRTSGAATLALGAITFTGGAINFGAAGLATTTSANTNGILGQRATVAGADFAANDGSGNIVAYAGYTTFSGTMAANTNYSLAGASSIAANVGASTNTLKITTTAAGQSLAAGTHTLTAGAILFTGADDYALTTSGAGKIVISTLLDNYGAGTLSLGALGSALTQFGTGTTVLTTAATADNAMTVNGGTVRFSDNLQIGTDASAKTITLNNGTLVADTGSGGIALDNAGANSRTIAIGAGGGVIDVIGGHTLTISGVISGASGTGPVTFGGASSNGTILLTAVNTYTGATVIRGGTLALGVANGIAGAGNLVMAGGTLSTQGFSQNLGTLTLSASSTIDLGSGASALTFADSSTASWGASFILGFVNFDAGVDSIRVGGNAGGLTSAQLSQITLNGLAASIDSGGYLSVSAIPEPSVCALSMGLGMLLFGLGRNRRPKTT